MPYIVFLFGVSFLSLKAVKAIRAQCNDKVNDMTREERIKGAVQEFMAKHKRQGKRTRKRKSVKLFSVDEPQREREERRKNV